MIKNTYSKNPSHILSAYHDNAAVLTGSKVTVFHPLENTYSKTIEHVHTVAKVETHNHPTAVCPFPGAATGSGGEIRDEGAVGQGSKPKAGLTGFTLSNLNIPGFIQPWEVDVGKPDHVSSCLEIILDAPLGAAAFNNEFGRPNICGYFRTFLDSFNGSVRGYHKPIMIAGGLGTIRPMHIEKQKIKPNSLLIVMGYTHLT